MRGALFRIAVLARYCSFAGGSAPRVVATEKEAVRGDSESAACQLAVTLLRQCPGSAIHRRDAARACSSMRAPLSDTADERCAAGQRLGEALKHLQLRGAGVIVNDDMSTDGPLFVKLHYAALPGGCRTFLHNMGVSMLTFGVDVAPSEGVAGPCPQPTDRDATAGGEVSPLTFGVDVAPAEGVAGPCPQPTDRDATAGGEVKRPDVDGLAAVAQTWEILHDGPPENPICASHSLQDCLRVILGRSGGCVKPRFWVQRKSKSAQSVRAACMLGSCTGCTWRLAAWLTVTPQFHQHLLVRSQGQHGVVAPQKGPKLTSVQKERTIEAFVKQGERISASLVREAFRRSGLPMRWTSRQLCQFVARHNKALGRAPASDVTSVAEVLQLLERWKAAQPAFAAAKATDVLVVGPCVVTAERVFFAWTCRGMLALLDRAKERTWP